MYTIRCKVIALHFRALHLVLFGGKYLQTILKPSYRGYIIYTYAILDKVDSDACSAFARY